ncbi:MAG: thymidine phosphorylase [Verrucomicrobia bacterium]|nr:thymidine phosphorylase [Verrucomicrobiota bacterium]
MIPQWIIEKKRDGAQLSAEEIRDFINGYTRGEIPDYQMAALAMAVFFRGMTFDETAALTDAMMRSGRMVDTSSIRLPKVDKHSTGGIGDKVSLLLAPLVACCGVAVPMISGRGLGITGGTLDKLESIPGYRTGLNEAEFLAVLGKCGCSMIGQTPEIAPADRKLYALRDVTGTVPSIPLISASIMSKKLAEGADSLVLDVKWGKGAFMKTVDNARELARTLVEIGRRMNKGMGAVITDMNQPLGRTAGNAVEIAETVESLKGNGPKDLMEVTMELCAGMLLLARRADTRNEALLLLKRQLDTGAAFEKLKEMVELHGGSALALDDLSRLPAARIKEALVAEKSGYVAEADAEMIGRACVALGAGRKKVEDLVDHAVGLTGILKIGEQVKKGEPLLAIHANDSAKLQEARALLASAFKITFEHPSPVKLITETVA